MVASQEANAHQEYNRRIVSATTMDTVRTTIFGPEWPHEPVRVMRNRVVNEWAGRVDEVLYSTDPAQSIGHTVLGGQQVSLPKFSALPPIPETTGDFEEMCLLAGESAGLVHDIQPASQIVQAMTEEAQQIIGHLHALLGDVSAGNRQVGQ
jgi:NAD(P)H-dependent flavin oxidoreductase YrpB (nitropropane dioxygenase family)